MSETEGRRYKTMSIRVDVYEKLQRIKAEKGFSSLSDVIAHLIAFYEDHAKTLRKLERMVKILIEAA